MRAELRQIRRSARDLNRMNTMRETGTGWALHLSSGALKRSLRLATVALSLGVVMSAALAHAADDDDENLTFEEKTIKSDHDGPRRHQYGKYRHRLSRALAAGGSAAQLDLPPPAAVGKTSSVANWPKDPDVQRAREAAAAASAAVRKKCSKPRAR